MPPLPRLVPLAAAALLACAPAPDAPPEPPFSFAILADPHISSDAARETRLAQLVRWLNVEAPARRIEFVLVVGDLGWGAGVPVAHRLLSELAVPWVPMIGDNEIVFASEQAFEDVFGPQLDALAPVLGLARAPRPVRLAVPNRDATLQNFGFTWRGVRFVGLDWASRQEGKIASELGELHDVAGGTLPWLTREIAGHPEARAFVLAAHIPMHGGLFDDVELRELAEALAPRAADVLVHVAGHMHLNYEERIEPLFDAWVTAATWSDTKAVRIGRVVHADGAVEVSTELVDVPF